MSDFNTSGALPDDAATPAGTACLAGENLADFFGSMPNGVAYCRMCFDEGLPADLLYLYVNPAFHKLTGLGPVVGKRISEVIPGVLEQTPEIIESYGRVARGGPAESFEIHAESLDRWLSIRVSSPKPEHFIAIFDDISERKEADSALRRNEQLFRSLINRNNAIILQIDPATGQILDANESASRFYGWSHEQLCARTIQSINQLDAAAVATEFQAAAREERNYFVFPHRIASGEIRTVEVHSSPLTIGTRPILVSIIHDISQRVRQAEQVERLLQEQSAILNSDIVGIVKLRDRKFVWANSAYAEMLGYSKEELIGLPTRVVYPSDQAHAEFSEAAYPVMQRNEIFRTEIQYRKKNGSLGWYRISGGLIAPGSSESIWAFADITERKANERKIAELMNEQQAILNSQLVGIVRVKDRRIVWVNAAFAAMFGYAEDELLGQATRIVYPSDQAYVEFCDKALAVVRNGEIYRTEIEQLRKDGSLGWYEISCGLLHPGSDEQIGVFLDATEKRRLRQELERHWHDLERQVDERTVDLSIAKEAADASNRAKSTFLANMSHELRTPMNGIMGMTAVALRNSTDPTLRAYLGKISQSSERLLAIINRILDVTWIESERFSLNVDDFELGDVLNKLLSWRRQNAREKGLQLTLEIAPELAQRRLRGDATRFGQVLGHLVCNAIKFTDRGSISVRIGVSEESTADVLLRLEVQDTGEGISPADQKRLFAPFEQVDSSMTRKQSGTGLGLAISKRLAVAMGGSIGVESRLGAGSVFWFSARLAKATTLVQPASPLPHRAAEDELRARYAGARILLADDEPVHQEVTRILLEEAGMKVDSVGDGAQAVELSAAMDYDLILMDLRMPKLSGIEATQLIRALPGRSTTPILALTASVFGKDSESCLVAGMNDFVAKPVAPEALYALILKWLSHDSVAAQPKSE